MFKKGRIKHIKIKNQEKPLEILEIYTKHVIILRWLRLGGYTYGKQ